MKNKKTLLIIIAILVIIGLIIGINIYQSSKEPEVIKIGAILPLTGELAEFGIDEKRGMELAEEEINDQNGIKGKYLRIIFEDSKSNAKDALNALQKLLSVEKPPVIFSLGSSISLALAPEIHKNKIVMVSVAATPKLTGISPYVFRNFPSAELQAKKLALLAYNKLNIKKVAILYINDDLGLGNRDAFVESFINLGGKIIYQDSYEKDAKDFRTIITKVLKFNFDAIYIPGYGDALAFLVKQLRQQGYKGLILSSQEFGYPRVLQICGKASEGVIFADLPYFSESEDTLISNFVKKFVSKYNQKPTIDAILAYDQTKFVAYTMREYGTEPDQIKFGLKQLKNFNGVSGNISILPNGDVDFSVVLKVIKNENPQLYQ